MAGGEDTDDWIGTRWNEEQLAPHQKQRMNAELAHRICGHRAISALLKASNANIWDNINIVLDHDSWCGD